MAVSQRRSRTPRLDGPLVVDLLDKGQIESLVTTLRSLVSQRPELAEKLTTE
jgi:hypothetical protein